MYRNQVKTFHQVLTEAIPRLCNRAKCLKSRVPGTNHCQEHQPKPKVKSARYREKTRILDTFQLGRTTLYFISCPEAGAVKIGRTDNIKLRFLGLQSHNPFELSLLKHFKCPNHYEEKVHILLSEHRIRGEWFRFNEQVKKFISELGNREPENVLRSLLYEKDI